MQIVAAKGQKRFPTRTERKKAQSLFQHGRNLQSTGHTTEAISAYLSAVSFYPNFSDALNNLAVLFMELGRYREAVGIYERFAQLRPDKADDSVGLIWALINDNRPGEALIHLDAALKHSPADLRFPQLAGRALLKLGLLGPAIGAFYTTLGADPNNHEAHICLALALFDYGDIEQAIFHGKKAFSISPTATHAIWISCVLIDKRRFAEALVVADEGIFLNSNNRELLSNRARALEGLKRHSEAMSAWRDASKAAPDNSSVQHGLAASLQKAFDANVIGHA